MATLREQALAAHRQAEEERLAKWRDKLEAGFFEKWEIVPDAVYPEIGACEYEGMLFAPCKYAAIPDTATTPTRFPLWHLLWQCPKCGDKVTSTSLFSDLADLGAALEDWDPEKQHSCPLPHSTVSGAELVSNINHAVDFSAENMLYFCALALTGILAHLQRGQ